MIWDLGISDARRFLLADVTYENWKNESILDICQAIRNGSNGKHGTTFNTINPAIINDWMAAHLEQKYEAKEREFKKLQESCQKPYKTRKDYERAVEIGRIMAIEKTRGEKEYLKYREAYFKTNAKSKN